VEINDGEKNHLHGGHGYHRKLWQASVVENGVEFSYLSPDGDEKYPGAVEVKVTYKMIKDGDGVSLDLQMDAKLAEGETKSTPINLT